MRRTIHCAELHKATMACVRPQLPLSFTRFHEVHLVTHLSRDDMRPTLCTHLSHASNTLRNGVPSLRQAVDIGTQPAILIVHWHLSRPPSALPSPTPGYPPPMFPPSL